MRSCPGGTQFDRIVRTTGTYTTAYNSESTVSISGTCFYTYNTSSEFNYNNPLSGDLSSIDTSSLTVSAGCTACQPTPNPTPSPSPTPTPAVAACYEYDLTSDGGESVQFSYTRCDGTSMSNFVPNGDSITVCAQNNTVTMTPNSGTITANSSCTATPSPTPTAPSPVPAAPSPVPVAPTPNPTPTAPSPVPAAPSPVYTPVAPSPVYTPTAPVAAPTAPSPIPTPVAPSPVPTAPSPVYTPEPVPASPVPVPAASTAGYNCVGGSSSGCIYVTSGASYSSLKVCNLNCGGQV